MNISYANIGRVNYSDSTNVIKGITTSVWFNSCPFRCVGCHNATTWDKEDLVNVYEIIDGITYATHLSLLGGEPLSDENIEATELLIRLFVLKYPNKRVHLWTGYSFSEVLCRLSEFALNNTFFLKVGTYEHENRMKGRFYGSSNQEAYILDSGRLFAKWSEAEKDWRLVDEREVR